jgi:hypothetical protein
MHPLKQGATFIIDERNVLKIHQNFGARVLDPGGAPTIFELRHPALGQAAADFQCHAISD